MSTQCEIPSTLLLGTSTGGLFFLCPFLAVCIVNQFVLRPSPYPGHAPRFSGWKNVVILAVPREDYFFSHLCAMLNGFLAESNPCAKLVCCSRRKECIRVGREHPLVTRSDQWLLSHHAPDSDLVSGLESGCLFSFGGPMDVGVEGLPKVKKPFQGYFYYCGFPHVCLSYSS